MAEDAIMPTPERLAKTDDFHVGGTTKVVVLSQGPLYRLAKRKALSDRQIGALGRYANVWRQAGLEPGPRSVDLNRVAVSDTHNPGMPATAMQADARRRYREAVQHLGLKMACLVEAVACHGHEPSSVGAAMGWRDPDQARAVAVETLRISGDRLADFWGML